MIYTVFHYPHTLRKNMDKIHFLFQPEIPRISQKSHEHSVALRLPFTPEVCVCARARWVEIKATFK